MLNSSSTGTFVLKDVAACLDVEVVNGTKLQDPKVLKGLTVTDLNSENAITLPNAYTKVDISAIQVDVQAPELTRQWKHLNQIAECMPSISTVRKSARKSVFSLDQTVQKPLNRWTS